MTKNDFIVIPTFNEAKTLGSLIQRIAQTTPDARIMVVDDDSPDGTQDKVRELMLSHPNLELYPHNQKAGFAKAYIDAMSLLLARESDLRSVTMMDADMSHDPRYLPELQRLLEKHDFVIGSRYVAGGGVSGWEWWRRLLSAGGNIYTRMVSGLPIHDITAGFNCIRAELLRNLDLGSMDVKGYAFQFLLKYRAYCAGASFSELPIVFKNREEGESKMHGGIILEALKMPWRYPRVQKHPAVR